MKKFELYGYEGPWIYPRPCQKLPSLRSEYKMQSVLEQLFPNPTVIMMVGAPGSGKTTLRNDLICQYKVSQLVNFSDNGKAVYISADSIRQIMYGSEDVQGDWKEIAPIATFLFKQACHDRAKYIIVDNTNSDSKTRKHWEKLAIQHYREYVYVVFEETTTECLSRNAKRDRVVPVDVVLRMHNTCRTTQFTRPDQVIKASTIRKLLPFDWREQPSLASKLIGEIDNV